MELKPDYRDCDGRGKPIPKGHIHKIPTVALRLHAPDSQPFASTSTASDVAIKDLDSVRLNIPGRFPFCVRL